MLKKISIFLLLLVAVYSRFLNLDWDQGWGFHPDENNLWGASRRVELFSRTDPEFYAYGGFPIYLYSLLSDKVEARAVSALAQTLIVILLFVIGRRLAGWNGGFLAAAMGTFSAGLVQAGHFLTVESLIGLFSLALFWSLLNYDDSLNKLRDSVVKKGIKSNVWLTVAIVVLGLGVGTKLSFVVFALPFFGRALIRRGGSVGVPEPRSRALARHARRACEQVSVLLGLFIVAISIFLLTNPFIFSKLSDVRSTLEYEAKVATGTAPVFYTRQFMDTIPGWFQAVHVFPYVIGWLFVPLFLIGVIRVIREIGFKESPCRTARRLLIISIFSAFLSFLPFWAKWTRYVVQVLPILILIAGVGAGWMWERGKLGKALAIATIISFIPQFLLTVNVYANEDSRVKAAEWAEVNIPERAKIFTEAMDLGIMPFNQTVGSQNITLFNFYELDDDKTSVSQKKLDALVKESDYFISVSQRVYGNSLVHPDKFPHSARFYNSLFDGSLGYNKIYESESPFTFYLLPFTFSSPEETFSVFDHPRVLIFKNLNEKSSLDQNP